MRGLQAVEEEVTPFEWLHGKHFHAFGFGQLPERGGLPAEPGGVSLYIPDYQRWFAGPTLEECVREAAEWTGGKGSDGG